LTPIAIRRSGGSSWQIVEPNQYPDEAYLQRLLADSPELIPYDAMGLNGSEAYVTFTEFWHKGIGPSDLLVVHNSGQITLVECKLATNPEARRTVLAQVFDYAASLMGMDIEIFNERASRQLNGSSLTEVIEKRTQGDFDASEFEANLRANIEAGEFNLVIAIDEMNDQLDSLLNYVEARSNGALKVFALEIRYHQSGDTEAIIPNLANPQAMHRPKSQQATTTVPEFEKALHTIKDEPIRNAALDLLKFSSDHAEPLIANKSVLTFNMRARGKRRALLTLESPGSFWLNAGNTRPIVGDELVNQLLDEVAELPGFKNLVESKRDQKWIKVPADNGLSDPGTRERFKQAILKFQAEARDLPAS
jgi:hypothetical protein